MKRAVITGLGIVSSIGNNQEEVLASLREGRSGITFSQELKDSGMRSHVWGNVKLSKEDIAARIDRKMLRFMSDASIYAFLSMQDAVKDAGLTDEQYQNNHAWAWLPVPAAVLRSIRLPALTVCALKACAALALTW